MSAGTGLRTMLRAIGCDEHHNRNQRLARLCHEAWRGAPEDAPASSD